MYLCADHYAVWPCYRYTSLLHYDAFDILQVLLGICEITCLTPNLFRSSCLLSFLDVLSLINFVRGLSAITCMEVMQLIGPCVLAALFPDVRKRKHVRVSERVAAWEISIFQPYFLKTSNLQP